MKAPTEGKLTPRQKLFVNEYILDMNGSRAYKAAKYRVLSDESALASASRMLRNVKVQAAIHDLLKTKFSKFEITSDRVLREITKVAFSSIWDYLKRHADGSFSVDLSATSRDQAAALQDVSVTGSEDGKTFRVKMHSKLNALEMLGRYLKLFSDTTPAVSAEGNALLADALSGKVSLRDAAYKFNMMGLPLPEALKIEWSKQEPAPPDTAQGAVTNDEIMRRYEEQMRLVGEQIAETMPERAAAVAELKKELESRDMFASGYGRLEP